MLFFKAPLHTLRKTSFFKALVSSPFNRPTLYDLGYKHKIALRPLTHASIRWRKKRLEPNIRSLLNSLLESLDLENETGWFFDVGANVGLYTWETSYISPGRPILAFEPDPENFELLRMTLRTAGLKKIDLCSNALSNRIANVNFHQDTITSATGSISGTEIPWVERYLGSPSKVISVNTTTMDTIIAHKSPSLIKIDVEGHEFQVLEGATGMFSQIKPILILESFPPRQKKVVEFLLDYGYSIMDADRKVHINSKTQNLFAWHPDGPLAKSIIESCIYE